MNDSVRNRLSALLGYGLSDLAGERTFCAFGGVIYTDVFTGDTDLGTALFNGRQGTVYKNEIKLDTPQHGPIIIDLDWGSTDLETELSDLVKVISDYNSAVSSKSIEDFSISYGGKSLADIVSNDYGFYVRQGVVEPAQEQRRDWLYF